MSFNSQRFPVTEVQDYHEAQRRPRRARGAAQFEPIEEPRTPRRPRPTRREEYQEEERMVLELSPEALAAVTNLTLAIQGFSLAVRSFMDSQDLGSVRPSRN